MDVVILVLMSLMYESECTYIDFIINLLQGVRSIKQPFEVNQNIFYFEFIQHVGRGMVILAMTG